MVARWHYWRPYRRLSPVCRGNVAAKIVLPRTAQEADGLVTNDRRSVVRFLNTSALQRAD